ncbi:Mitogen-activated protein kinase kinase 3 isoform 1 [Hibiscus syriacus]|uniref:Mitogen-activated protein kinase kinase 3 isoform 1 n=1 Tax=Hibiscus syriacus TaxID=106335 RepID=A0A6A2Y1T3_HIBSY|nr:Mitogen-activated protein kinase kinase 3 isoform 1 [Hibiscus syriacus]
MASSSSSNFPCAACKFLRRKCMADCTFAPYFPPEEPQKFFNVHKIFGASNVRKLINEVAPHQRQDAVNSLAYEAKARELDALRADLIRYAAACGEMPPTTVGRAWFDDNAGNFYCPDSLWNEPYGENGGSM